MKDKIDNVKTKTKKRGRLAIGIWDSIRDFTRAELVLEIQARPRSPQQSPRPTLLLKPSHLPSFYEQLQAPSSSMFILGWILGHEKGAALENHLSRALRKSPTTTRLRVCSCLE